MKVLCGILFVLFASVAQAQAIAHPGDSLIFNVDAPDLATAQAASYFLKDNGVRVVPSIPNVTCFQEWTNLPQTFTCYFVLPTIMAVGQTFALTVTALFDPRKYSESMPSNLLSVTLADLPPVLIPSPQPRNLGIKK